MDCEEIKQLLDAYALGAVEGEETSPLEAHMADCVRCWEKLSEAQRAAALLALSVPIREAPPSLRRRILERARKEVSAQLSPLERLRRWWPAGIALLGAATLAAVAFAALLQVQVSDLRSERDRLRQELRQAEALLAPQQELAALLAAPDMEEITLAPASREIDAVAVYYWSPSARKGGLLSSNLPPLEEGEVYQLWLIVGGERIPAGILHSWHGMGQMVVDLTSLEQPLEGVGITREKADGSTEPTGEMLLYGSIRSHP